MGCSIFYDKRVLAVKHIQKGFYEDETRQKWQAHNYILVVFQHISTGTIFINAVTHLKAKEEFNADRVLQAGQLIEKIKSLQQISNAQFVILNGDLNCSPDNEPIQMFVRSGLTSVYDLAKLEHTTVKFRKEIEIKIEDYIFYQNYHSDKLSLEVAHKLEIPALSEEDLHVGYPKAAYPSDHFMVGATFKVSKK